MIEQVYDAERWEDEPAQIDDAGYLLHVLNGSRKHTAQQSFKGSTCLKAGAYLSMAPI